MVLLQELGSTSSVDAPLALVLPGAGYPSTAPLLYWTQGMLLAQGWRVFAAAWEQGEFDEAGPVPVIEAVVADGPAGPWNLIIGKSLGSIALPAAVRAGMAGIWLTPLLDKQPIVDAALRADASHLFIGGRHDEKHWEPEAIAGTAAHIVDLPSGDHSLLDRGGWRASQELQRATFEAVELHVRRLTLTRTLAEAGLGLRRGAVEIADSQDGWGGVATQVMTILQAGAPASVVAVEHIGSTAVAGLAAKPILDLAVGVDPEVGDSALAAVDAWLAGLGFFLRGDANGIRPDRMYGYELDPMIRLVNVHVLEHRSSAWNAYIDFRDRLRASDGERDAYADLKRSLARQHPDDRVAYVEAKGTFIAETARAARDRPS